MSQVTIEQVKEFIAKELAEIRQAQNLAHYSDSFSIELMELSAEQNALARVLKFITRRRE